MTKHTPGPWKLGQVLVETDGGENVEINSDRHHALAMAVWKMEDENRSPQCEANARLIAAAPELLKALDQMLRQFNEQTIIGLVHDEHAAMMNASAAIAKARGEA